MCPAGIVPHMAAPVQNSGLQDPKAAPRCASAGLAASRPAATARSLSLVPIVALHHEQECGRVIRDRRDIALVRRHPALVRSVVTTTATRPTARLVSSKVLIRRDVISGTGCQRQN